MKIRIIENDWMWYDGPLLVYGRTDTGEHCIGVAIVGEPYPLMFGCFTARDMNAFLRNEFDLKDMYQYRRIGPYVLADIVTDYTEKDSYEARPIPQWQAEDNLPVSGLWAHEIGITEESAGVPEPDNEHVSIELCAPGVNAF